MKHSVYLAELFQSLVSARETGESFCMSLKIRYRGSINNEAIFLITKDNQVVVQFRAAEDFLLRKNIPFESWMNTDKVRLQMSKQNSTSHSTQVQNLRHGMKKINVEAEVLETQKPQLVHTQYGNTVTLVNAWIADETGKIRLCLWNEQANFINAGDTIQIKNASVSTFKGERQLRLGKSGTITMLQSSLAKAKQKPENIAKNMIYA